MGTPLSSHGGECILGIPVTGGFPIPGGETAPPRSVVEKRLCVRSSRCGPHLFSWLRIPLSVAILALPVSRGAQQPGGPASSLSSRGYVDSKLCYGCHATTYATYTRTGM